MQEVHIKCYKCGEFNSNAQICVHCDAILDVTKRRLMEREKQEQKKLAQQKLIPPSKMEVWMNTALTHPSVAVRVPAKIIKSVYTVIMAIGMFIAWLVSMLLA